MLRKLLLAAFVSTAAACAGSDGAPGPAGSSCSVVDNGNGTKTVSCPGSAPVTIADGAAGESCTVVAHGDGTRTITCGATEVTLSDGLPCTVVDLGGGTKSVSCPGAAPVTVSYGTSCSVVSSPGADVLSCTDGTRVLLAQPLDGALEEWEPLPGLVVTILGEGGGTGAGGSFAPGDRPGVTFTVRTADGRAFALRDLDAGGAWLSGPTFEYQHVLPPGRDAVMYRDVTSRATLNDDGTFSYVFPDPIPAAYGAPLFDTSKFQDGELAGPLDPGTYTIALVAEKTYSARGVPVLDAASASLDVGVGTAALSGRALVGDANCATCHGQLRAHEGRYRSVTLCLTCHTAGAEDAGSTDGSDATPVTIDFRVLVHKLHAGAHLPSVQGVATDLAGARTYGTGTPYVVGATDYSGVLFPAFPNFTTPTPRDAGYSALTSPDRAKEDAIRRGVTACRTCHGDPDGAGPSSAPAAGDGAFAAPSRRACGSCHDDVAFDRPYTANGSTMPAGASDGACGACHTAPALTAAHLHPLEDPLVAGTPVIALTALSGGTGSGGAFTAGDSLTVTFTVKDAAGADVPITSLDSLTLALTGPTTNRQIVVPGLPATPFDVAGGRLAAASTSNKGTMSKVQPGAATTVSETLVLEFDSAASFSLRGTVSGALGAGALAAGTSVIPAGASVTNVALASAAVPQQITIAFGSSTTYSVTGSVSGPMGSGTLPAATTTVQRFTSTDATVSFNIQIGTTAAVAGNAFRLAVVKGAGANPVLFAVVAGRTAFAAGDRFHYDYVAPAASYGVKVPMDVQLEYLGRATGAPGDVFTAANLPVWYGRQTLYERTATSGTMMSTLGATASMGRHLSPAAIDADLAGNDFLVVEAGTASEEYVRVQSVDAVNRRITLQTPLRFAHAAGATLQEVTLTYRQEGPAGYYVLDPAAGTIALNGAATAGNAFILGYRTDARFGWRRSGGDVQAPFYYAPLSDDPALDETWGDWRGKPLVDGTYTVGLWGFRAVDVRSGPSGAYEWQTYRAVSSLASRDLLYGSTAVLQPYAGIDDAVSRCNACHLDLSFHGGGRRGADNCLLCHATPGPAVGARTLLHLAHANGFPVRPNGAAACATCHGATAPFVPTSRDHPTAQVRRARDWMVACTGCHASTSAVAHADTMTSSGSGYESCATCHGPDREQGVELRHRAR